MATLLLSVMGAFAEFERALIRERQWEGIALAKRRGAYRGRKKALSVEQRAELRQRVAVGEGKARRWRGRTGSAGRRSTSTCAPPSDPCRRGRVGHPQSGGYRSYPL